MNRPTLLHRAQSVFLVALLLLGGCASIDPDGEWRGTPEARLRACQAMFGPAAVSSIRDQLAAVTGGPSVAAASGGQCPGARAAPGGDSATHQPPTAVASGGTPATPARPGPRVTTPEAIERVFRDSEQAYAETRYQETIDLLDSLLGDQPRHVRGWLRKANALHRLERREEAAVAYRRASEIAGEGISASGSTDTELADVMARASANLAILGIEQAKRALDALGPAESNPVAAAHRRRIESALRAVIGPGNEAPPPRSSSSDSPFSPSSAGGRSLPGPETQVTRPALPRAALPRAARPGEPVLLVDSAGALLPAASAAIGSPGSPGAVEIIRGLGAR